MTLANLQMKESETLEDIVLQLHHCHVKASQSLETGKVLKMIEETFSLTSSELSELQDLTIWSWKMSKGFAITTKGKLLPRLKLSWKNWAIRSNGLSLIAKISESHKTEKEYISLVDILEPNPEEHFFLSERVTKKILGESGKICHTV